jgi:hypothetical protein
MGEMSRQVMLSNMHAQIDFTRPYFQAVFAATNYEDITIWDRKTLCLIDIISLSSLSLRVSLPFSDAFSVRLLFPLGGGFSLVACIDNDSAASNVTVWDMGEREAFATFQVDSIIRKSGVLSQRVSGLCRDGWFPVIRRFPGGERHPANRTRRFELDPKLAQLTWYSSRWAVF